MGAALALSQVSLFSVPSFALNTNPHINHLANLIATEKPSFAPAKSLWVLVKWHFAVI